MSLKTFARSTQLLNLPPIDLSNEYGRMVSFVYVPGVGSTLQPLDAGSTNIKYIGSPYGLALNLTATNGEYIRFSDDGTYPAFAGDPNKNQAYSYLTIIKPRGYVNQGSDHNKIWMKEGGQLSLTIKNTNNLEYRNHGGNVFTIGSGLGNSNQWITILGGVSERAAASDLMWAYTSLNTWNTANSGDYDQSVTGNFVIGETTGTRNADADIALFIWMKGQLYDADSEGSSYVRQKHRGFVKNPWQIFKRRQLFAPIFPYDPTAEITAPLAGETLTITLVDAAGSALPDLTGLSWAWFDESTPDAATAPVNQGTGETTDGAGEFSVQLTNTTLTSGGTGMLALMDSTGYIYAWYRITL
jgi:hypothetical protein